MTNSTARPPNISQIRLYQDWLRSSRGLEFRSYQDLWRWSVTDLDTFWQSLWDYHELESPTRHRAVLAQDRMPGAVWFPGAQVNYSRQVLRHVDAAHAAGMPAIISENEAGDVREMTWPELKHQVACFALYLRQAGIKQGDFIAAYLPNIPETIVAFLACASIGAVWSICAPDMGLPAVVDRLQQVCPRVLIGIDGIRYAGRPADRSDAIRSLRAALPSVESVVLVRTPHAATPIEAEADFATIVSRYDAEVSGFEPDWLPFDHPLWVLFSSGTTGLPKAIVQGHGGILVGGLASAKNADLGCSYEANNLGERYHWYSTTGWVMWNAQIGGLLGGCTICIFDGSPSGSKDAPDWTVLWRFAARHKVTYFGAGSAFYGNCLKAEVPLAQCGDLSRIRALGSTGSPLAPAVQAWGTKQFEALRTPDIWWSNISGGTELCTNLVAGYRELPQIIGRMQCRQLGSAVEAWDDNGVPVTDSMGELVCTRPLPSMPLYFLGDSDGHRYRSSYFEKFPGVWCHGDWIRIFPDGSCVIYGRSDATINRHGIRMGTSEIYAAVDTVPEVKDSMLIDLEYLGRKSALILFVTLVGRGGLNDDLKARLAHSIRSRLSPRFVPDRIVEAPEIPYTLSGKKMEIPIRRILLGQSADNVISRDAMANPDCLAWYLALAANGA